MTDLRYCDDRKGAILHQIHQLQDHGHLSNQTRQSFNLDQGSKEQIERELHLLTVPGGQHAGGV